MKDNVFLDTNILVYAILQDKSNLEKTQKAINLLKFLENKNVYASIQILNELYNVLSKNKFDDKSIQDKLNILTEEIIISPVTIETVKNCWNIKNKYKYSLWDSLVLSSAIENNCDIIYSEDMQDLQKIENTLTITNPFK